MVEPVWPAVRRTVVPPSGVVSRRSFVHLGALGAAAAALGGCSAPGGPSSPSGGSTGLAGDLNLFTWAGYDGADVIKSWYDHNGIKLTLKGITNEDVGAYLKSPAGKSWDATSLNQGDAPYWKALGLLSEVTVAEVPALGKMLPFFKDSDLWKVRDGVYSSVPWTWGPIGINYRKDKVKELPQSWMDILAPSWKGRIGTIDSAVNNIAMAACAVGVDPGKITSSQLNGPIKDYLLRLMPNVKVVSASIGDQVNTLVAGDVDVQLIGLTWIVVGAQQQKVDVGFMVPAKEGSYGFVDCVVVLPWAQHRRQAIAYCNALMEGPTAVAMQNSLANLSSNAEVNSQVDRSIRSLYPEDLAKYTNETLRWNISWPDDKAGYAPVADWMKLWEAVKASI